jgi:hypothetical protein
MTPMTMQKVQAKRICPHGDSSKSQNIHEEDVIGFKFNIARLKYFREVFGKGSLDSKNKCTVLKP